MKNILSFKLVSGLIVLSLVLLFSPYVNAQVDNSDSGLYSKNLDKLAESIFASFELLEEGKTLYKEGNVSEAKIKFQKALKKDPNNKKAQEYLNLCTTGSSSLSTRVQSSTKLTIRDLDNKTLATKSINVLENKIKRLIQKETVTSKPTGHTVLTQESTDIPSDKLIKKSEILVKKGDQYYEKNKYEEAYQFYKEALLLLNSI